MFETEKFTDMKIKTSEEGKEINTHKIFLARSPVFEAMLNHDTKEIQENVIKITDFDHEIVEEMVRYLHTDEVPKLKELALELLVIGNKYDLPGLVRICKNFLKENITEINFASILITADQLEIADLKDTAFEFIINNHKAVFANADWKSLKKGHMELGMEVLEQFISKHIQK